MSHGNHGSLLQSRRFIALAVLSIVGCSDGISSPPDHTTSSTRSPSSPTFYSSSQQMEIDEVYSMEAQQSNLDYQMTQVRLPNPANEYPLRSGQVRVRPVASDNVQ